MIETSISNVLMEVCLLTAIPLISISVVGFIFSFIQSLLQVQDQSSQYFLKILSLVIVWIYFGKFYEERFMGLFKEMLTHMMYVK